MNEYLSLPLDLREREDFEQLLADYRAAGLPKKEARRLALLGIQDVRAQRAAHHLRHPDEVPADEPVQH